VVLDGDVVMIGACELLPLPGVPPLVSSGSPLHETSKNNAARFAASHNMTLRRLVDRSVCITTSC
jgi:hypothetical protein